MPMQSAAKVSAPGNSAEKVQTQRQSVVIDMVPTATMGPVQEGATAVRPERSQPKTAS